MYISFIITAYNCERYLAPAIASVLAQSYTQFELLLINDGTTDNTLAIMEQFARQDSRITILNFSHGGMAAATNQGLARAKYDWIARMDGDDLALPVRLERQVRFLKANPEVQVTSCWAAYINAQGKKFAYTTSDLRTREKFSWYMEHNEPITLVHSGVLFNKEAVLAIGGYRGQFW